jgi:hypothetical protein
MRMVRGLQVYRARELGVDQRVCRGVAVGGCVARPGADRRFTSGSINAHAHNSEDDVAFGWVCFDHERHLFTPAGRLSRVFWHEYAHLLVPNADHGRQWQEAVTALGWPSEAARYRPGRRSGARGVRSPRRR